MRHATEAYLSVQRELTHLWELDLEINIQEAFSVLAGSVTKKEEGMKVLNFQFFLPPESGKFQSWREIRQKIRRGHLITNGEGDKKTNSVFMDLWKALKPEQFTKKMDH